MALSIRERIEQQVEHLLGQVSGWTAERWSNLGAQTDSTASSTVAVVMAGSETISDESAGGSSPVAYYRLEIDVVVSVTQAADDSQSTAQRANAARATVIETILADPRLTETLDAGTGSALALDTIHTGTEGPYALEGDVGEGTCAIVVSFDVLHGMTRNNPAGAPGVTERA